MMTVFKEFKFSAAHSLDIDGHECSAVHGHNYKLRIEVTGEMNDKNMVIDFKQIKSAVQPLVDRLDHSMLNDTLECTTSEYICWWFYTQLNNIPGLSRIEVRETDTCGAYYDVP